MNFLSDNNVLYQYQSDFRKFHSTDTCLSYLHDKIIKGFDSGLLTGIILIDIQKAFDTIDHNILIRVLLMRQSSGTHRISEIGIFIISMENANSDKASMTCGVPQGSILGPLLFLIYINDMSQAVDSELLLYADDTYLVFQHKNVKTI